MVDGPGQSGMGAGLVLQGTPGEVASGTFKTDLSLYTAFGPGELRVNRIAIGFGV